MSALTLHTPGSGLMETHVKWKDIEEDMQSALETAAVFGPDRTIREIGAGRGYLSRVSVVEPNWQGSEPGEDLPGQFVVKLSTGLALTAAGDQIDGEHGIKEDATREKRLRRIEEVVRGGKESIADNKNRLESAIINQHNTADLMIKLKIYKAHNREVSTYAQLNLGDHGKSPCPKIYATRAFSDENPLKGYLLMEFFDRVETVHSYHNLTPKTLHQPLRVLAALAASSLNFNDAQKAKFTFEPVKDIYGAGSLVDDVVSVAKDVTS